MHKSVTVSAPGSLMIMGEHAVLEGHPALVFAINKRLSVTVMSCDHYRIISDQFPPRTYLSRDKLPSRPSTYIEALLALFPTLPPVQIEIQSEFESTLGFGSSAALIASLTLAFERFLNPLVQITPETRLSCFGIGLKAIHDIQGAGSGADLAASLWGGLLLFNPSGPQITPLPFPFQLKAIYSGLKMPTKEVIAWVQEQRQKDPQKIQKLIHALAKPVGGASQAFESEDLRSLSASMQEARTAMKDLGLENESISEILNRLKNAGFLASKISGSGLGDCVISIFEEDSGWPDMSPYPEFTLLSDWQGVNCHDA